MKHILLFENYTDSLNVGDNTNYGVIEDKTAMQYCINGQWYHHSIIKADSVIKKHVLRNRGRISPSMVISAFANPVDYNKVSRYAEEMRGDMMENDFPPIKGFPIIITDSDIERFGHFMSGEPMTDDDLGEYAWVTTDGHHRTTAALEVELPFLRTKLDTVYMGDENDYSE